MAIDLTQWLTDDLGFTAEEVKDLLPKFEGRADRLDAFATKALTAKQEELDGLNTRLTSEMAEWATLKAGDETKAEELRSRLENTVADKARLEQKLLSMAEQFGVDPKTVVPEPTKVEKPNVEKTAPFDTSKFATLDTVGTLANIMVELTPDLLEMADEHRELTGKRLDTRPIVREFQKQLAAGKRVDVRAIWEQQHKIGDLRTQQQTKQREQELQAARDEGYTRARTEALLPGSHTPQGHNAVVFKTSNVQTGSKLQRPQPGDRISRALTAVAQGKYRVPERTKTA